jgi:hypothetical protein
MEKVSGHKYIDEVLNEILDMLPEENREVYLKTFKNLYEAGKKHAYIEILKYKKDFN